MALLRYGSTPWFGVKKAENEAFLVDSISYNVSSTSYDQTGNLGDIVGRIYYDQTITFDMSGTLLYDEENPDTVTMPYVSAATAELANNAVYLPNAWNTGIKSAETAITSLIDTTNIQAQAGGATTLSVTGSVFKFEDPFAGTIEDDPGTV